MGLFLTAWASSSSTYFKTLSIRFNASVLSIDGDNIIQTMQLRAVSFSSPFNFDSVGKLFGTLKSLREDYANDFLSGFNEMVDADIFTDVLEQAEYLLSQDYFRASAVVAGVALESHLRKLAEKNSIPITTDEGQYIRHSSICGHYSIRRN